MRDFRKYEVWNVAMRFGKKIYQLTSQFPPEERYGMISQIRRASVSITSNIAEGCSRSSEKDFARFIEISLGSAFEVESLLRFSHLLEFIEEKDLTKYLEELSGIQKMLNSLYSKLRR